MQMWTKILTAFAATTVLATAAHSAGEPYFPKREKSFTKVDLNKNGEIEATEFTPVALRGFTRMDVNGDKSVTSAEIDQRMAEALNRRRDRIMQLMDRNNDGTITESELDNVISSMFNGADADHSGGLTLAEMQNFKRADWRKSLVGQGAN
jgi:Ca2+-binding EF-hand superfamily protein